MKPVIVFFSRSYQAKLFPLLKSEKYDSVHVTLTEQEKIYIESLGIKNVYCFELFDKYSDDLPNNYLMTSLKSDRYLGKYDINTRIMFLRKEKAFWESIFNEINPIAVVNEQVAIEISEVMYLEARKKRIKYLAWMTNPMNGYFYWIHDPLNLSLSDSTITIQPSEVSYIMAKEYIKSIIEKNEIPYYLIPFQKNNRLSDIISSSKGIIKALINVFKFNKNIIKYEQTKEASFNYFERSLKAYFISFSSLKDIKKFEIVLFPLHYEPESSLLYLSEFVSEQTTLIENIAKCLRLDQVLVIKEHPAQPGMLLTSKFQKLLKKTSNLYYLPHTVSSYDIIKKSTLVVTCTSHLGWEALILGKPVFLLGKMFYDKYPYINRISSFDDMRDKIRNNSYQYPNESATEKFIAQLIEVSYKGFPFESENLYKSENINDLIYAIEKELGL